MTDGNWNPLTRLALAAVLIGLPSGVEAQVREAQGNDAPLFRLGPSAASPLGDLPGAEEVLVEDPAAVWVCPDCGRSEVVQPSFEQPVSTHPSTAVVPGLFQSFFCSRSRHSGLGHPLLRESWLFRPFSVGWFMGMIKGTSLIDDWVGMSQGYSGGYRLGWDTNYHWGGEIRVLFASVELFDSERAKRAQQNADTARGLADDDPRRSRFDARRDADLFHWDLDVIYYPWGDSQWRPYLMAGIGTARVIFTDRLSVHRDKTVFAMPLGVGVKYRCNDLLALRVECTDNIAFGGGSGFDTLHSFSANGGVEIRFGGTRKAYWPYNPGRRYW